MISTDELLQRAAKAPKPHRDVDIYLDDDTADQIAALEQELENLKTDTRLGDARPQQIREQIAAIETEAAASIMVLRFTQMPAEEWAAITSRCPQRFDVPVDRLYGYNVQDAGREAAPVSGARLVQDADGVDVEESLTDGQWQQLFDLMAGRDFTRIIDAIFDLNDYSHKQRLDAARKASRAGSGVTSS